MLFNLKQPFPPFISQQVHVHTLAHVVCKLSLNTNQYIQRTSRLNQLRLVTPSTSKLCSFKKKLLVVTSIQVTCRLTTKEWVHSVCLIVMETCFVQHKSRSQLQL